MQTETNGPIYLLVQEHLQGLLDDGSLQAGSQIPSERKLMAQFETSNMPVRQAIQHFIDKDLFERVHGRGTFVKQIDAEKTNRIAMLYVYDNAGMWASPFYTEIMRGIEDVSISNDKRLILQSIGDNDIYSMLCKIEDEVDGFLLVDLFPSMIERVEKYVREKRKPISVINYPHRWSQCHAVVTENISNSRKIVEHCITHGHKNIAYFYQRSAMGALNEIHPSNALKLQGYRQALELHDINYNDSIALEIDKRNIDQQLQQIIDKNVSAIYCSGSALTLNCLIPAINKRGLRIPEDISVITYDNTRDISNSPNAITCIDTDISELGQEAMRCLLNKINEPKRSSTIITLQGEVLDRQSVKILSI